MTKFKTVRKAVLPVAGMGTRILPATKAMPKEMLTVVDKPLIQYAVEECLLAGIEQIIFVTGRGKSSLEDHFDVMPLLEQALEKGKKTELLKAVAETNISEKVCYVRQSYPLGLGHAVACAKSIVGDEPFAVILPDDLIVSDTPCVKQLIEAYNETGGNIVATREIPWEQVSKYGVLDIESRDGKYIKAKNMVEKPERDKAPSNITVVGRYVLNASVMSLMTKPENGGEIQLTDAIAKDVASHPIYGVNFEGVRYDCGNKLGYIEATLDCALGRKDLKDDVLALIKKRIK